MISCQSRAQDYSAFHPISSISPNDTVYTDLQFLKEVIGDSRIVLLGEQSHGEGAVFLAKTRLIKFLHREMGFDVLAFESGLYDCAVLWDSLKAFSGDADPLLTAQKGVFGIWTRSLELRDIFQYLIAEANTSTPLILSGFDSQFTGEMSDLHFVAELSKAQTDYGIGDSDSLKANDFKIVLQKLISDYDYRPTARRQEIFFNELDHITREFEKRQTSLNERDRVVLQTLKSARILALQQFADSSFILRDRQMAENLKFLCDLYPEKKIIVWAASSHIMTDNSAVEYEAYKTFLTMGTVFHSLSDEKTTTIGFTSYGGETYNHYEKRPVQLEPPPKKSIEQIAHDFGHPYAVIDFAKWKNRGTPIYSRPFGNENMVGFWWNCFDLMFFIDQCTAKTVIYQRK
jgi:erythromycin esterase